MLNKSIAMGKLLDYLKSHRREKVRGLNILLTAIYAVNAYIFGISMEEPLCGAIWGVTALMWLYQAFFFSDKERAMEKEMADDRPLDIRLREAFADYTPMQLQAILDDDLRSEEVKGIAGEMLKERQMET